MQFIPSVCVRALMNRREQTKSARPQTEKQFYAGAGMTPARLALRDLRWNDRWQFFQTANTLKDIRQQRHSSERCAQCGDYLAALVAVRAFYAKVDNDDKLAQFARRHRTNPEFTTLNVGRFSCKQKARFLNSASHFRKYHQNVE